MPRPEPVLPLPSEVVAVLCDADGNLFPSEEPAFEASAEVTNDFLRHLGSAQRWEPEELRAVALGRNFRALAADLARELGKPLTDAELADWVAREQVVVTRHLRQRLSPNPRVTDALGWLAERFRLAIVTSSALRRLDACLVATGLDATFPEATCFSAQDSLPVPTSKPDPAVYLASLHALALHADQAVAVEDAVAGVQAAVAAGIPTIGNLAFVPDAERVGRARALRQAGACEVADDWEQVVRLLASRTRQVTSTREVTA